MNQRWIFKPLNIQYPIGYQSIISFDHRIQRTTKNNYYIYFYIEEDRQIFQIMFHCYECGVQHIQEQMTINKATLYILFQWKKYYYSYV